MNKSLSFCQNGNTALSIAKRLGYISVVDTLKVVTEEVITTTTVSMLNLNTPPVEPVCFGVKTQLTFLYFGCLFP